MRLRYQLLLHPVKAARALRYCHASLLYDRWHGIQTGKQKVARSGPNGDYSEYDPTEPRYIRWALRNLPITPDFYSFVDFGSGKGRVLIGAAVCPFRQVIGVECSSELHEAALKNIECAKRIKCHNVKSVCMDAREFAIPESPCVFFFYNPFRGEIMETVLSHIRSSLACLPRPVFLVYVNPVLHDVFMGQPGMQLLKSRPWCNLYAWLPNQVNLRTSDPSALLRLRAG
jgi:hypothetical protein